MLFYITLYHLRKRETIAIANATIDIAKKTEAQKYSLLEFIYLLVFYFFNAFMALNVLRLIISFPDNISF